MSITAPAKDVIAHPYTAYKATLTKAWVDAITAAMNTASTNGAGFLTADAAGRAVPADDWLDAATIARVVDAKAITGASIADLTVDTLQIKGVAVTEPKLAPSILTAKHCAVGAAGATVAIIDGLIPITVGHGSTVLDAVTLDATYGKVEIDDVWFKKGTTTGSTTDAVQLCTDAGGTTAISSSLALNTIAAGGIVRTTSLTNTAVAAGAHLYVKRTATTANNGILYVKCHRIA
jgi:hypothetical protein